jgi:hypothetical protein
VARIGLCARPDHAVAILREVPPHLDMDDESVEMWTDILNGSVRPQDVVMTGMCGSRWQAVDGELIHMQRSSPRGR